ncbi:hypothetical protein NEOLEDRAFT_1152440 [Neolentinus lepideus HHB14362 ss-1]|uniref:Uncharacterized protein n=1 Tax=Neolentinus lepideus HHB14362 ss-1 TaxID=1314782 RepID=A0A165MSI7_9AGAM|nr:hypothetical protein NEOLEDRAFT_1152440 [Neolentinus lepideus HHB14362 ss-1]
MCEDRVSLPSMPASEVDAYGWFDFLTWEGGALNIGMLWLLDLEVAEWLYGCGAWGGGRVIYLVGGKFGQRGMVDCGGERERWGRGGDLLLCLGLASVRKDEVDGGSLQVEVLVRIHVHLGGWIHSHAWQWFTHPLPIMSVSLSTALGFMKVVRDQHYIETMDDVITVYYTPQQ